MGITYKSALFRVLTIGLLPVLYFISCNRLTTHENNYVELYVSEVSEGRFTIDFLCGKNTEIIEYAVCYAVNMKTDSVAFMAGELENIDRVTPQEDGTASVSFDFSEPLDFGPYTVYARAISKSGQISRLVTLQVCALTTGLTVEYLSRATIKTSTSYYDDETILIAGIITQYEIDNLYEGSMDIFLKNETKTYSQYVDTLVVEAGSKILFPVGEIHNKWGRFNDGMYIYFLTTDGTEITGAFSFRISLPDEEPDVPLPDNLIIEKFTPRTSIREKGDTLYILQSKIIMGKNTEVFGAQFFESSFLDETLSKMKTNPYYDGMTDEEMLKKLFLGLGPYIFDASLFVNYHDTDILIFTTDNDRFTFFGKKYYIIACPANSNFEAGTLIIKEFIFPEKEEFPEPVPEENPIRPETGMDHAGIISGLQPSQRFNCR